MKAQMQHTEESIRRLSRVQYRTYGAARRLMTALTGCVLIVLGAVGASDRTASLVLLALGCWTMMSLNAPADRNAKKLIECAKGRMPSSEFSFSENEIEISGDGQRSLLKYGDIYSLICDAEYVYLFRSRYSAYMIPLNSVETGSGEELKRFLAEKTGLPLEKPGSLMRIRFRDLKK